MATVFMKWLETRPGSFERGIKILTLGRIERVRKQIAREFVQPGYNVLDIGCGTGQLTILMAACGAQVTAIDVSGRMLEEAQANIEVTDLVERITLHQLDVTQLGQALEGEKYDLITCSLVLSELRPETRAFTLRTARTLLKPTGRLIIVDEVVPEGLVRRVLYWLVRAPLALLTWLVTRTSTNPLQTLDSLIKDAGLTQTLCEDYLGGSLLLLGVGQTPISVPDQNTLADYPRLEHRVTLKTILLDFASYLFRIIPPYTKVKTGLYRIGNPGLHSAVLVTGNYDLTVRRLVKQIDRKLDCWLVVADSHGINVWCAAGGGHFTAEAVISAMNTCGIDQVVDHHALILPQLCANGVDGWKVRRETGWGVHWGPIRASDIPDYLAAGRKKTEGMRHVRFQLPSRLEMTTVMLVFYGLFAALLGIIFWRPFVWTILALMIVISYIYGAALPWIPGRDGLEKGAALSMLTILGLWTWSFGWERLPPLNLFNWSLGLGFLAFFIGAEFQGMSPQMRGEQSNWIVEGLVGLAVLLLYGAGRVLFGGG